MGLGAGRRGGTVAPACRLEGGVGASNALRVKSQPLCPELSIWGASLPNIAPLQTAGCWGLDPPRWSTDSPSYHSGSYEEAAELQSTGGEGESEQRSQGAASKSHTKCDMAFVLEPCISSLWAANLGRKV